MKGRQNCSGSAMVEVLAAFCIMVLIIGMFSRSMKLAGTMLERSERTLAAWRDLEGACYLEGAPENAAESPIPVRTEQVSLRFLGEEGFTVEGVTLRTVGGDGGPAPKEVVREHESDEEE